MTMTDPIADLFTRVRNAAMAARKHADIPPSTMKAAASACAPTCAWTTTARA